MPPDKIGKVGQKYGITIELQRELTPEEADFIAKTLKMTASALHLNLKDDVVCEKPIAPRPPRK